MSAIPIDVLRAFVAVVDCRGFTRAAESLGRTQPTVSLQIKRLEALIEAPLLENSTRLTLTRMGEICLEHARGILAGHDEMVECLRREREGADVLRLGLPSEFAAFAALHLAGVGEPGKFEIVCDTSETLLERLSARQLDLALAVTDDRTREAFARWQIPIVWVASSSFHLTPGAVLPLIATPEGSVYFRIATAALRHAARKFKIVCRNANFDVLRGAVEAGQGICVFPRSLAPRGARVLPQAQIPALPDLSLGLFAPEGASPSPRLIEHIADWMRASEALDAA